VKSISIWFTTDLHGSSMCFRKVLNSVKTKKSPSILIIGGDITGKSIVPILKERHGHWKVGTGKKDVVLDTERELEEFEAHLACRGAYGWRTTREMVTAVMESSDVERAVVDGLKATRVAEWVDLAEKRLEGTSVQLYVNAGNDDPFCIDSILDQSSRVVRPEGKAVELGDGLVMISCGYANKTPWNSPRDVTESQLFERIRSMAETLKEPRRCIFNLHCPPLNTALDQAPKLDSKLRPGFTPFGVETSPVGSLAVRNAILHYQPSVGLHGHVHEQHAFCHLGRTLCFNPGSEYWLGRMRGAYLKFQNGELIASGLTREDLSAAGAE